MFGKINQPQEEIEADKVTTVKAGRV